MVSLVKTRPFIVRMEGLEPAYLSALDPKSSVSTNFTTSANFISLLKGFDQPFPLFSLELGVQRYLFILNKEILRKKNRSFSDFFVEKSSTRT